MIIFELAIWAMVSVDKFGLGFSIEIISFRVLHASYPGVVLENSVEVFIFLNKNVDGLVAHELHAHFATATR